MENIDKSEIEVAPKLTHMESLLTDQKAGDPFVHIFRDPNPVSDAIIIVTATSRRHAQGLADHLLQGCREAGYEFLSMEGYDNAQWILVDCNDVMIHIFLEETRALYRLEELCQMREPSQKEAR